MTNDIQLFDELMHFRRRLRHSAMRPEEIPHRHGEEPRHRGPHAHPFPEDHRRHGNRPFSRERVMQVLLDYKDGARQKDLADTMHINPSSMSELIDKLQSDGYIIRTTDPDDKRATRIVLSEVGRARAYELQDERSERIRPLFQNLTEEEKEELLRLLRKLNTEETEQ